MTGARSRPDGARRAGPLRPVRLRGLRRLLTVVGTLGLVVVWALAAVGGATATLATPVSTTSLQASSTDTACSRPAGVTFDAQTTSSRIGTTMTFRGRVQGAGGDVRVRVVDGPHEDARVRVERSGDTFTASLRGERPGVDVVVAELRVGGVVVARDEIRHTWTNDPPLDPVLTLAPGQSSGEVGEQHVVSLEVAHWDGQGEVTVSVLDGPHAATQLRPVSARSSQYGYVGTTPGTDRIRATLVAGGRTFTANPVTRTWTPRTTLVLRPAERTVNVGGSHSVAVEVTGTDEPPVLTVVEGPNAGSVVSLNRDGDVYYGTHVSDQVGTDVLQARLPNGKTSNLGRYTSVGRPPELTPTGTRATVGQQHTLQVAVTGTDERPVVEVVRGVNAPRTLQVSGDGGRYTVTYGSDVAGVDALQAVLPASGGRSNIVDHTWIPVVGMEVVGTPLASGSVEVRVTVTGTPDPPVVTAVARDGTRRLPVERRRDGAWWATVPHTQTDATVVRASVGGGEDTATINWIVMQVAPGVVVEGAASESPVQDHGTSTLRARAASATAVGRSVPVVRTAVEGEGCLDVAVGPARGVGQVGTAVVVTSTVRDDLGEPVPDAEVRLTGAMDGADVVVARARTDRSGVARFTRVRTVAGTETLTAAASAGVGTGTGSTTFTWLPDEGVSVSVDPAAAVSPVDSRFTATVTVRDEDGQPLIGAEVQLTAAFPDELGQDVVERDGVTDSAGRVSFTYKRVVAGTETLTAVARHAGLEGQASTSHVWEPGPGLVIEPAGRQTPVDSEFTAVVVVSLDGRPVEADVVFTAATEDPAQLLEQDPVATDENGLASFTYTRDVAVDEVVTAVATVDGVTAQNSMAHAWVLVPGLQLGIAPAAETSAVGTEFTATVTVTDGEAPLEGASVSLVRSMPGHEEPEGADDGADDAAEEPLDDGADEATHAAVPAEGAEETMPPVLTDGDGRATFTWSRSVAGLERVVAHVVVDDERRGEAAMAHLWRAALEPEGPDDLVFVGGGGFPGSDGEVAGSGCPPSSTVDLDVEATSGTPAQALGAATADVDGEFRTTVRIPDLPVGRYTVTGTCPPVTLTGPLDVVVVSSTTGTAAASTATVAMVLTFFVLLGGQLLRSGAPAASTGGG